jgi:hypothetical protein
LRSRKPDTPSSGFSTRHLNSSPRQNAGKV